MSHPDTSPTSGAQATNREVDTQWTAEEAYWRTAWQSRPYATADLGFERYRPAYRYGVESAHRLGGRHWNDVEDDLRSGGDGYEHRGTGKWEDIKDAVRDAWDRIATHITK